MNKIEIVLDADVIIHFAKGNLLSLLPDIFPGYTYVILSKVYDEIKEPIKRQLDQTISLLKKITIRQFEPKGEMKREYAILKSHFGIGESACMAYCRFTNNVIGSSNIKDIRDYCDTNQITYLTTIDFLYFAIQRELLTKEEAKEFVNEVKNNGSILPNVDFYTYVSSVTL